ncbi:MAG: hypothetical protein KAW17_06875 [Candidatus Eisenbacteria sp.]|nr:hypothetical protein [Candidatus Eisenbacteria bacterium]
MMGVMTTNITLPVPKAAVVSLVLCSVFAATGLNAQWILVDSVSFTDLVPAGEQCHISLESSPCSIGVVPACDNLTPDAEAAVAIAPGWLRSALRDNFRRLDETSQNLHAALIINAVYPYIDEICFEVAHIAPEILSASGSTDVLLENVESLYAIDSGLDYADIVDYGGEDYYSTVLYRVLEGEDVVELELPRDIYYWHIVHPKLHKETPGYINPATGLPADPPTGVFWRDFLMNHNDTGYPLLRTCLESCSVLWKCQQNTVDNGAVGALTQWIKDVMTFQSNPHHDQPVRIYHQHIGTCSVHSYLTSAAARAALIPAAVTAMYSDNHKINEFWERRWIAWEPVNTFIDYPEGYENWGWDVATVFSWRGDSFIWDTTERYTDVCTLDVNVTDSEGHPVDGVKIKILSEPCVAIWGSTAGWTGRDGHKRFFLGDNRDFDARAASGIGGYPPVGLETIITGSVAGVRYEWNVTLPGTIPVTGVSPDTLPANPTDDYRLVVEYSVPSEVLYGKNFDDRNRFSEPISPGHIDFFICNEVNFNSYIAGESFDAFEIRRDSSGDTVDFVLPASEPWCAVFSNSESVVLTQELEVTASLYTRPSGTEGQLREPDASLALRPGHPNPFSLETHIAFVVPHAGETEVAIYDVSGRKRRTLATGFHMAGEHTVVWDGQDDDGRRVASGVYFCDVRTGDCRRVGKILVTR